MKLMVIGFGQCGSRIADEFARLNKRARIQRGIEVITDAFAVDTDPADLDALHTIKPDYQHRILFESKRTDGDGVVRMSEIGAEITMENSNRVIEAIRVARRLFEADAFLLIAGVAGGTGSGGIPIMAQSIKDCYKYKPVYSLVILPFKDEEETEERTIYNAAISLKSIYSVADAVFVADNQRYVTKDPALRSNPAKINPLIVEPFYDLLCAGEEEKTKYIGASIADAGNIIQTLAGWTAIGYGKSQLPAIRLPFGRWRTFRKRTTERRVGIQAMEAAISQLSVGCDPADAGSALYLVSAPAGEMRIDLFQELGSYLKGITQDAVIKGCDYPRGKNVMNVTVILSEFSSVEKIKVYYNIVGSLMRKIKMRQAEAESKLRAMKAASRKIPSLL
ncbi:MAG: cell division protein FtsZ [Dehalococcoidia bacterium]|nr:cell division protein FtsZ [Dehalococcoidia bacterium]